MNRRYAAILIALIVAIGENKLGPGSPAGVMVHSTEEGLAGARAGLIKGDIIVSINGEAVASLDDLTRVKRNYKAGDTVRLRRLLTASREIWRESGGAFDPTVMPLVNAWGFGYKSGTLPSRAQLDSLLLFVGMDKVTLHGDTLLKSDPRVMLDFSSIAKGMACDEIGRMLARNGAENWLVEIGGEVMASGVNNHGKPWHVSVDMPSDDEANSHESALVLTLDSGAVATSGNYRKWRIEEGNKLSHIIDPHTGDSRTGTLLSVTVIANDCMTADAWATACMVMGEENVKNMMGKRNDLGVMTISADTVSGSLVVWSNAPFAKRVNQ